jgi:hypothetical protein
MSAAAWTRELSITPELRARLGRIGAWAQAVRDLAAEYQKLLATGRADDVTFRLQLTVERPTKAKR